MSAWTHIETKTLGTAVSSIEFTNIPQDATDLVILASLRTADGPDALIEFNGSGSGYTNRYLIGNGSTTSSGTAYGNYIGQPGQATATSNTFSNAIIYIPNYTSSNNKSVSVDSVNENNATAAQQVLSAILWSNSAAITSFLIKEASNNNFVIGSSVSLYKVLKGSSGGVTVS